MLLKTTGDLPDDVDIASPDNEDIEKYVQARAESDGKVIDKVIANIEKAQERQKEAYKRRNKQEGDQALQDHTRHGGPEEE
ncbi:unnamed protein product [Boreogadus saida]